MVNNMSLKQIAGIISALIIIGTAYTIDGRWVRCPVYAEEMSQVKMRQYRYEERSIQKEIYDIEDRLANPKLPEKRKGIYQQRLRELKIDLDELKEEKTNGQNQGGVR